MLPSSVTTPSSALETWCRFLWSSRRTAMVSSWCPTGPPASTAHGSRSTEPSRMTRSSWVRSSAAPRVDSSSTCSASRPSCRAAKLTSSPSATMTSTSASRWNSRSSRSTRSTRTSWSPTRPSSRLSWKSRSARSSPDWRRVRSSRVSSRTSPATVCSSTSAAWTDWCTSPTSAGAA